MKTLIRNLTAFSGILFFTVLSLAAGTPALTPDEIAELKQFASLDSGKGHLLTPPRGSISQGAAQTRDFIQKLVLELAPELKSKDVHYVVNVYGSSAINAWVQQYAADDGRSQESEWAAKHPNEIWPLRKAWGFPDDKKSIYEVGITTSLLRALSTKDEVAFVLGHELTHLLEGHTDQGETRGERFKTWWSSQTHEAVADHLGIDKILGKYDLDAAYSVMDILHPKSDKEVQLQDVASAGTSSHHAEGVRLSGLQFYIEYLRKSSPKAIPRLQQPLPAVVKLSVPGREAKESFTSDPTAHEKYIALLDKLLKNQSSNPVYVKEKSLINSGEIKTDPFDNLISQGNELSYAQVLKETLDYIDKSSASKVAKMNTLISAMTVLGSRKSYFQHLPEDYFNSWTEADFQRFTRFLVANSSGEGAWTLNDYRRVMSTLPIPARYHIEAPFLSSANGQKVLQTLTTLSPTWNSWVDYMTTIESFVGRDGFYASNFASLINAFVDPNVPESELTNRYKMSLVKSLGNYKNQSVLFKLIDESGPSYQFVEVPRVNTKRSSSAAFSKAVEAAMAPHEAAFKKVLLTQTIKTLANPNPGELESRMVNYSLNRIKPLSLDPESFQQLSAAYDVFMRRTMYPTKPKKIGLDIHLTPEDWDIVAKKLELAASDRPKTLEILRFLLVGVTPMYFRSEEISAATKEIVARTFQTLNKEEIWSLTTTLTEPEQRSRREIDELVKKYKFTDARDFYDNSKVIKHEAMMEIFKAQGNWKGFLDLNIRIHENLLQFSTVYGDGRTVMNDLTLPELKRVISNFEVSLQYSKLGNMMYAMNTRTQATAKALLAAFMKNLESVSGAEELFKTYQRISKLSGLSLTPTLEEEARLREVFQAKINAMPPASQVQMFRQAPLRKMLGAQFVGQKTAEFVSKAANGNRKQLKIVADQVAKSLKLESTWPDAFKTYRDTLAQAENIQPNEIAAIFPADSRTLTEKSELGTNLVHGLSAFSTFTRSLAPLEQIEMIEFVMGRTEVMPKKLKEYKDPTNSFDLQQIFLLMREELKFRDVLERSLVVNTVLTGANGLVAKADGLKAVKTHLLAPMSADKKEISGTILDSLTKAEGKNISLFLSYALAQKPETAGKASGLSEALVLRSFLDFYGVPGVKLAQYLAFTNEFKDLQASLETYQDAAMPISYYDALVLLQKRLGSAWDPAKYRVVRIIGSGSVNIAIEYTNLQTGKNEVASIARDEIETKTAEDFRRFQLLVKELTRTPELKKKFNFVAGLMNIIERSVSLEFDKEASFKMQKSVQKLYSGQVNGWNIKTVDAYSVIGKAILMEKAAGKGARKILKTDPATYESAMRAFMQVEYGVLRGVNQTNNWIPVPLHANPDVHDGQVMIDVENRTVTVLDFGQAVSITNEEREFALDILSIISGAESASSAEKLIQKFSMAMQKKNIKLDQRELAEMLKGKDRMDVFVHLISTLHIAGLEVPLSSVHWVLAANRLIKLGEKVRLSQESSFKWLIGMRKVGVPLAAYNAGKDVKTGLSRLLPSGKGGDSTTGQPRMCKDLF